jgi:hypothetical protein
MVRNEERGRRGLPETAWVISGGPGRTVPVHVRRHSWFTLSRENAEGSKPLGDEAKFRKFFGAVDANERSYADKNNCRNCKASRTDTNVAQKRPKRLSRLLRDVRFDCRSGC